jgi:probable addiction module antidote protein
MIKKGISKKQENYKKLIKYNPEENLKKVEPKDVLKALMHCIEHSDYEAFRDVVYAYVKAHNKVAIAKSMGVSRRALYHMISDDANPTIKNIMSFYQAIKKAA